MADEELPADKFERWKKALGGKKYTTEEVLSKLRELDQQKDEQYPDEPSQET
ncbi:MAG: hypothetical protein KF708_08505 [Pirellulales bacterium]|nr:hypothetical protein [Pirellulales bacterium]